MGEPAAVSNALCLCSFGAAPCSLEVLPDTQVMIEGMPAGTIMASEMVNLPTFGMCSTLSNPEVASATAAALGVLTPMPCVPVLVPWVPGSPKTLIGGQPALNSSCKTLCSYGGEITISFPGSIKTTV